MPKQPRTVTDSQSKSKPMFSHVRDEVGIEINSQKSLHNCFDVRGSNVPFHTEPNKLLKKVGKNIGLME